MMLVEKPVRLSWHFLQMMMLNLVLTTMKMIKMTIKRSWSTLSMMIILLLRKHFCIHLSQNRTHMVWVTTLIKHTPEFREQKRARVSANRVHGNSKVLSVRDKLFGSKCKIYHPASQLKSLSKDVKNVHLRLLHQASLGGCQGARIEGTTLLVYDGRCFQLTSVGVLEECGFR
ncbi:hypothetical protein LINGRAHAP2_LOCUS21912 [Linum grandiflorum]